MRAHRGAGAVRERPPQPGTPRSPSSSPPFLPLLAYLGQARGRARLASLAGALTGASLLLAHRVVVRKLGQFYDWVSF